MPDGGPVELAGTVQYQGNLTRLRQCFASRTSPAAWGLGGMVAGGVQFKQSAGVIHAEAAPRSPISSSPTPPASNFRSRKSA